MGVLQIPLQSTADLTKLGAGTLAVAKANITGGAVSVLNGTLKLDFTQSSASARQHSLCDAQPRLRFPKPDHDRLRRFRDANHRDGHDADAKFRLGYI